MIFNSIEFLIFFGIVFLLYFFVPQRFRWIYLLAASFFFYGFYKIEYLVLLIVPTLIVYFITLKISRLDPEKDK